MLGKRGRNDLPKNFIDPYSITGLPQELLHNVLSYLSIVEMVRVSSTCRYLRSVCLHSTILKKELDLTSCCKTVNDNTLRGIRRYLDQNVKSICLGKCQNLTEECLTILEPFCAHGTLQILDLAGYCN
eukprot:c16459_g1_i1.p1 GENE.c16459_g1_i1~~c16459_g1_i1.p1  ORF type:complete len:128 (-),score=12.52 c16459_g1_i1:29-412(-)